MNLYHDGQCYSYIRSKMQIYQIISNSKTSDYYFSCFIPLMLKIFILRFLKQSLSIKYHWKDCQNSSVYMYNGTVSAVYKTVEKIHNESI